MNVPIIGSRGGSEAVTRGGSRSLPPVRHWQFWLQDMRTGEWSQQETYSHLVDTSDGCLCFIELQKDDEGDILAFRRDTYSTQEWRRLRQLEIPVRVKNTNLKTEQ